MARRILVTSALPYANGPIHIGHLLEYVQADTWVRFMRMVGHEIYFVCADDAHGTPVMLEAEKLGIKPEDLLERTRTEHLEDFTGFGIKFDNYHTTHSQENRELSEAIFAKLQAADLIVKREVEQLYDPKREQFLADRYIRGTCPKCGAVNQTGDNCEVCSATYEATDMQDPQSALSGAKLQVRSSEHYFFTLNQRADFLRDWIATQDPGPGPGPRLQKQVVNKLQEWFTAGLQDWDISRDAPYFGFLIPGTKDKYFYVWLDAPIGYMASFANLCKRTAINFDDFWHRDSETEVYHFIGKDIMNFHGLFWPAILEAADYRTPTRLFIHGFLTVNGAKMSKSKGTFITAASYRQLKLDPDWFRYYIISKLNDRIEDVDLHLDDFINRVNADLVGKLANIPSRVAKLLHKHFDNCIGPDIPQWIDPPFERLTDLYERRRFSDVTREIMVLAERVNQKLEQAQPWKLVSDTGRHEELHAVCSAAIASFCMLVGCIKPVIPRFAAAAENYLATGELVWSDLSNPLRAGHRLGKFTHLMQRVTSRDLEQLQELNRATTSTAVTATTVPITIDDFNKVDLRVAEVCEAEAVEGSTKLLRLLVSLGGSEYRTIFAGLQGKVDPPALLGRKIVVCANLAPRKMRFGVSEAMVLAASGTKDTLHVLILDDDAPAGALIS